MRLNFLTPPAIPTRLPASLSDEIAALQQLSSQQAVLQKSYDVLTSKYRGYRLKTITRLWELFMVDVDALWARHGFLHCTSSNYLLKILLVKSGKFSESDITFRWTLIYYWSPHQYVRVRIGEEWTDIDLWGKAYGIPFGKHAHGLKSGTRIASNI
jgi:hypothetical protein